VDYNGDGYSDLAIGVPNEGINGKAEAGMVNVIYGSASGLSATAVPDQRFFQDSPDVADASEVDDHFGEALASGDFNNDGYNDTAASAPGDNAGASSATPGVVNIIFGSASGLSATAIPDDVLVGGNRLGGVYALASGDFDGDGFADLAMGQPLYDASAVFFEIHSRGAVTALYGSGSGLSGAQVWTQDTPSVDDVAEDDERFGAAVSTG
jgi:hypothetical protein